MKTNSTMSKHLILRFISNYLKLDGFFLHDIRQLHKFYPKLKTCKFEDVVKGDHAYSTLYHSFMILMCSSVVENKLLDRVHKRWISNDSAPNWKHLILTVFYYFKLFFPAALFWYKSAIYDRYALTARTLLLKSNVCIQSKASLSSQYNLCDMWNLKVKFLRGQLTTNRFYPYNIINNIKLTQQNSPSFINGNIANVSFRTIERLVKVYRTYSYLVENRRFIICKEKAANSKYARLFKLRFITAQKVPEFIEHAKIEPNTSMFFLFKYEGDLVSLVTLFNNCECTRHADRISVPRRKRLQLNASKSIDSFFNRLRTVCNWKNPFASIIKEDKVDRETITNIFEEKGFTSLYSLDERKLFAYVKNRVIHLIASFRSPLYKNTVHEKKGKPLVKIEKMIRTMTISRYKTDTLNENDVSFNINFQGSISFLQLILSRFLNESKHLGCRFTSNIWTSNVCTTSDTIHAGILNPHVYREKCLKNNNHLSYPMINFPAMMTLINDNEKEHVSSIINNRTSLNTCSLFGKKLKNALKRYTDFITQTGEIDFDLIKIFYDIETNVKELLPKSIILLIHLLYLHKDVHGYDDHDIVHFFTKTLLCSRMMTTSNRAFSTFNLYSKKYKSDAIDNVSIKSLKYFDVSPPLVSRDNMYQIYTRKFRDVGCLNKNMCQSRGRNSNLIDLILNSKESFFRSDRCYKLLTLLREKYSNKPNTQDVLELFFDYFQRIKSH